jgi:16S rRNA (uracil1498-N3)-methyltransferase
MSKIRIFSKEKDFGLNRQITIADEDFDYLFKVMRSKVDDQIYLFNDVDGEWLAKIILVSKKSCLVEIIAKQRDYYRCPNISLAFAPVKNVRIDFIASKATELGVRKFIPIITKHSVVDKINYQRFEANIKEAARQCQRVDIAEILPIRKLHNFLVSEEIKDKILILCDESGFGSKASEILTKVKSVIRDNQEIILLIGPEGGFSEEEFVMMRGLSNLYSLSLGPRILRADTACISGLTLVQEFLGDF